MYINDIWKEVGYVIASDYRLLAIRLLANGPLTPKEVSKAIGCHVAHASRTLRELMRKGIVICVNPEARKGRLYALSELGKKVLEETGSRRIKKKR